MLEKLDVLDRKILVQLDINSRRSTAQIAKKLKTSKNVVNYRINRLRKLGVIQGYYTVIDTMRLGYYNFRIYIKLRETSPKERNEIVSDLVMNKSAWWVAQVSSPWDVAIILLAKTLHDAQKTTNVILEKHKNKIHEYLFVPYVELKHFPKTYLAKVEERPSFTLGSEDVIEVSKQEIRILKELSQNARIGTVELAKKIKTTPMVIRYAIKKLIKNKIILGFRVLLDYDKINYEYYWVHLNVSSNKSEISLFLQSMSNTAYFDETIGGWDIDFALHISKEDKIDNWLNKINEKFGSSITEHVYIKVTKNEKVSYMPQY